MRLVHTLSKRAYSSPATHPASAADKDKAAKMNMASMSLAELHRDLEVAASVKEKYKRDQIWTWIYNQGAPSFDAMTNVSKSIRETLNQKYELNFGSVTKDTLSEDGTRKILVSFGGQELRNLTAGEIVSQLMQMKRLLYDFPAKDDRVVSNIVFMGQGEPFYNYRNLVKAIDILTSPSGLAYSKRRITVSTSGVVPKIKQLGIEHPQIGLAISLHAVTNELRSHLVTANNQWPIEELMDACKNYGGLSPSRRITFEYVMLKGVNDSDAEARKLVELLKDIPSLVNLIPFNPWPGSEFESSSNNRVHRFSEIVEQGGISAPIRWPRGRDILAACGQLKTETPRVQKSLPDLPE